MEAVNCLHYFLNPPFDTATGFALTEGYTLQVGRVAALGDAGLEQALTPRLDAAFGGGGGMLSLLDVEIARKALQPWHTGSSQELAAPPERDGQDEARPGAECASGSAL